MKNEKVQDKKPKEETIDETNSEIEQLTNKLEESELKYKRALADYQNLEKRVRDERIGLSQFANRDLLLRFLPVLDTLILAKQHSADQTIAVCVGQFLDTLKSEGVVALETDGKDFDPETMEVVTTTEGKEGVVIQEVRTGYLLNDKLLRPAQVIVGNGEQKE